MLKVKVTSVGNSMGILLPKEALSKMKAVKGDTLTPYQPDFNEQIETAEGIMKRYKNTLRELAK
jgi:antitoxin component of MazEF toxin-antitoxin module